MVTARITNRGVVGQVSVTAPPRTTIADPKFKPKPNVAMTELTDTDITVVQDGEVILYDATTSKFKVGPVNQAQIEVTRINGGSF